MLALVSPCFGRGANWKGIQMRRLSKVALAATAAFCFVTSAASAAAPRWECVPAAAGQPVTSGGTGAAPTCSAGQPVLAPTFVSSGVGGMPTVQFTGVNVQVVSGAGSTHAAVNGLGNLIVGYAENAMGFPQTGSHDLIVGSNNGWTGYGEIVGGTGNQALGNYASAFGQNNEASGRGSLVAGAEQQGQEPAVEHHRRPFQHHHGPVCERCRRL